MDYFNIFFDTPAWLLGQVIGAVLALAMVCGSAALAIYAGVFAYQRVRIPYVRMIAAVIVGIYLSAVLYRSTTWTAVSILDYMHRNDD